MQPQDRALLRQATEAIIQLANEVSREAAKQILHAHGVERCNQLPADRWQAVLDEAKAAFERGTGPQQLPLAL